MAKHEITIRENTGATKASAPYLGNYVSKETVKIDPISEAVAKLCGLPAIQVQTILTGAFDQIARMQQEDGAVRCNFDGFAVCQVIKGLFPSSDAAFDPAVNTLELAILLNDDVRNFLVNVVPAIVTDDTATKVRVHNVADVETPRPYQVIHGKHPFCVTGINLVTTDEGAEVYLEDPKGTKFPCTVDEVKSKQEFIAHTNALLEGGDYKCWVKSRGGDAEGTLQSDFRKVKYLYVEPDPLVTSSDGFVKVKSIDENPIPTLGRFTIRGENVGYKSSDPERGLPDHGLMGALATVDGQPLSWHCTAFDDDRASEATFQSDGSAEELEPGEYTAALTLNYAVDDGTGVSHLEPLVIENVKFTVGE